MSDDDGDYSRNKRESGDLMLPKATVFRTIKDVLPEGYRCSSETGNLIMECCMEFMRMISDETSQLCAKEGKSTIGADHVLKSLESLGFHAWRKDLDAALSSHKEISKKKPKMNKNPMLNSGLSHEELVRQQRALFAQAAASQNPRNLSQPQDKAASKGEEDGQPPLKKPKTES
uniref:Transcription factor CBF/NF-Y/archaeal histone domain-containing protein n=1 Tax=Guillardia theta TaxID=55529 RepID=A0A7S4P2S8_GUITH|mmetsp:Transcript_42052/g.132533  ORF Transcript_42052/g.132533 Transcript_42052/m.132533 type:complete len:174 (+) Transcript_42052:29-550(+)